MATHLTERSAGDELRRRLEDQRSLRLIGVHDVVSGRIAAVSV